MLCMRGDVEASMKPASQMCHCEVQNQELHAPVRAQSCAELKVHLLAAESSQALAWTPEAPAAAGMPAAAVYLLPCACSAASRSPAPAVLLLHACEKSWIAGL